MSRRDERVGAYVLWVLSFPLRLMAGIVLGGIAAVCLLVDAIHGWEYLRGMMWWCDRCTPTEIAYYQRLEREAAHARPEGEDHEVS